MVMSGVEMMMMTVQVMNGEVKEILVERKGQEQGIRIEKRTEREGKVSSEKQRLSGLNLL